MHELSNKNKLRIREIRNKNLQVDWPKNSELVILITKFYQVKSLFFTLNKLKLNLKERS